MIYSEVFEAYKELEENLTQKKEAIIKKDLEKLNSLDENLKVLVEKINKFDLKNSPNTFSDEQKAELRQ